MLTYAVLALALLTPDPDIAETQTLLFEVEQEMRDEASQHDWSPAQLTQRAELLDQLHAYAEAGVFPHNHEMDHEVPIFIDAHGTHCAVAYLILASGHGALAQALADEDNHLRLPADEPRVAAWAAEHGFTTGELSRIQRPGYRPRPPTAKQPKPQQQIVAELTRIQPALKRCGAQHKLAGQVTFRITPSGRARMVKLDAPDAGQRCVSAVLKMARFPTGASTQRTLPLG